MKTLKKITFIICLISSISCTKNDDDLTGENHLSAKIDGVNWFADVESSNTSAAIFHGSILSLTGSEKDPTLGSFLLNINKYKGEGNYTIGIGSANKSYGRFSTGSVVNNYQSWNAEIADNNIGTGTVTISSDNGKVVKGTFTLSLYNKNDKTSKKITEGSFQLPLKTE